MKCRDIEKKFSAYLEGIASSEEKEGVEDHLSSCQSCRKAFKELKRTVALVRDLDPVESPPWFTQKIMSRVRVQQESKKSILQRLFYPLQIKVPLEAFATVLIVVAAFYLFKAIEPEIKGVHAPVVTEQAISKEEASKQAAEPKRDTTILGGKVALEGVSKPQKEEGVIRDKNQPEKEVKEGPKQRVAAPTTCETPSSLELANKTGAPEEPPRPSEPLSRQAQAYRQPSVPAGVEQETDSAAKAPVRGEKVERRAFSATAQITTSAVRKPGTIDITLQTREAKTASGDIENILNQLGAQNINKESLQSTEILTAELHAEKAQELLDKLKLLGEVKEKGLSAELPGRIIRIRIEIANPS